MSNKRNKEGLVENLQYIDAKVKISLELIDKWNALKARTIVPISEVPKEPFYIEAKIKLTSAVKFKYINEIRRKRRKLHESDSSSDSSSSSNSDSDSSTSSSSSDSEDDKPLIPKNYPEKLPYIRPKAASPKKPGLLGLIIASNLC